MLSTNAIDTARLPDVIHQSSVYIYETVENLYTT